MNADVKPSLLKPRWSKVFTDLWDDKTRTGLVVASIAVGVFAIGMIISAYVILGADINRSYAAVNPPNIEIWTDAFGKDMVQAVQRIPGVQVVEGRRIMDIRVRRGDELWKNLTLIGKSNFRGGINLLAPLQGTQFPAIDEVIVSQNMLFITGFNPGDEIELELPDGTRHHARVAGAGYRPDRLQARTEFHQQHFHQHEDPGRFWTGQQF